MFTFIQEQKQIPYTKFESFDDHKSFGKIILMKKRITSKMEGIFFNQEFFKK